MKRLAKLGSAIFQGKAWTKFHKNHNPGQRIFPNRNDKDDAQHQLRFDAGETVDGKKTINLQINSQASAASLKEARGKLGTDAKLGTSYINMDCPEEERSADFKRAIDDCIQQARDKIG
jgi:hypothetical protein